jgi:predicted RNA-binding protein with PUA-like domain
MATFLLKTEPDDYSYDDLVRDKKSSWTGVTSPGALLHMRAVRKGDEAFIYHTGNEKAIVGLAQITTDAYEDPKKPGLTAKGDTKFPIFDVKPLRRARTPVTLATIKADKRFADFELVTISRLGVMPVPPRLDKLIRQLARL